MIRWILVSCVLLACSASEETKRDRYFLQGNEALQDRNYQKAIDFYDKAIHLDPYFASAYNNRGVAKIETGRTYEAVQDYNQAIAIDSAYFDAIFNRAYAYEQIGRITQALNDLQTVKRAFPDSAYVYFYQGLLQTKQKQYDSALVSFRKVIRMDSANSEARVNLATLYYYKGELDTAKSLLFNILESAPGEANALNTLSQVYLQEENYVQALSAIEKALSVVPAEPYFLNNRGEVYLKMDSLDLALQDINSSILLDPSNAWAYRNKGNYFMRQNNYQEAIRLYHEALSRNEQLNDIYTPLGSAYQQLGDIDAACQTWRKGVENQENGSAALFSKHCGQ